MAGYIHARTKVISIITLHHYLVSFMSLYVGAFADSPKGC